MRLEGTKSLAKGLRLAPVDEGFEQGLICGWSLCDFVFPALPQRARLCHVLPVKPQNSFSLSGT